MRKSNSNEGTGAKKGGRAQGKRKSRERINKQLGGPSLQEAEVDENIFSILELHFLFGHMPTDKTG